MADTPIPIRLNCPECGALHIDEGEFATKPHHTHSCQECGMTWRPAVVHTVGVRFLPGFKNEERVMDFDAIARDIAKTIMPNAHSAEIKYLAARLREVYQAGYDAADEKADDLRTL